MTIDALTAAADAIKEAMRLEKLVLNVLQDGKFVALSDLRDDVAAAHRIINTNDRDR